MRISFKCPKCGGPHPLDRDTEQVAEIGKVRLTIRPRPKAKAKLAKTGKVKVSLHVRYTPTGGEPNSESRKVTLKLRRR